MNHLPGRIIFGLAMIADAFSDFADCFSGKNLIYDFPKNKQGFVESLRKLTEVGDIEKVISKGEVNYRLTVAGQEKLIYHLPFFRYQNSSWDHLWRIIIYDIPEKRRAFRSGLRRKIVSLGFGQWQKSVWVTPHPVASALRSYLETSDCLEFVQLYEARSLIGDEKELSRNIWHLGDLEVEYHKFITSLEKNNTKKEKRLILRKYYELLLADPGLPKELLPKNWIGFQVKKHISKLLKENHSCK
ncbi:MAG: PaaX domain protein [Candidatus Gottesmanbacteria bacterium GW2011_GWA2_41_12]|uniref:PaaX domain protein n=2 Tax=Candidatus Gottesmaniibacteriota TaxID=1752720 RepID=A0A0G0UHH8_9BACT|nr:MAG: PaaX domain protein [Candidatus Gottesmanbacteria bacterium GW2011_GWC2_39_8]KKR88284.1 MAG: PaaX domain protein [Candidatus Gottesmanbacteria bacterium GW2011_GWA2_41_12]